MSEINSPPAWVAEMKASIDAISAQTEALNGAINTRFGKMEFAFEAIDSRLGQMEERMESLRRKANARDDLPLPAPADRYYAGVEVASVIGAKRRSRSYS